MEDVVVGDVAVVAGGDVGVAAVLPRGVLRVHDVAVDARLGGVAQVGGGSGDLRHGQAEAGQQAQGDVAGESPAARERGKGEDGAEELGCTSRHSVSLSTVRNAGPAHPATQQIRQKAVVGGPGPSLHECTTATCARKAAFPLRVLYWIIHAEP